MKVAHKTTFWYLLWVSINISEALPPLPITFVLESSLGVRSGHLLIWKVALQYLTACFGRQSTQFWQFLILHFCKACDLLSAGRLFVCSDYYHNKTLVIKTNNYPKLNVI